MTARELWLDPLLTLLRDIWHALRVDHQNRVIAGSRLVIKNELQVQMTARNAITQLELDRVLN